MANINGFDTVADNLTGTASADTIRGLGLDDTLSGLNGFDKLFGDAGDDNLFGGEGGDHLYGGAGDDLLDGGGANDKIFYDSEPGGVIVDLLGGTATDGYGDTDTLTSIENVVGSQFGDTILGNSKVDNF